MTDGVTPLDGKETGIELDALTKRSQIIEIISPFISMPGVDRLFGALKGRRKVDIKILTRAEPQAARFLLRISSRIRRPMGE